MPRLRLVIWGGAVASIAFIGWVGFARMPGGPSGVRVGDADRMEELGRYLEPVAQGGEIRGERGARTVDDPFKRGVVPEPTAPGAAAEPPALRVSAILISGDRRVAIIDDALVAPGDVLPGGERVAEIQQDAVVLVRRDGTRQIVRIDRGEGQ